MLIVGGGKYMHLIIQLSKNLKTLKLFELQLILYVVNISHIEINFFVVVVSLYQKINKKLIFQFLYMLVSGEENPWKFAKKIKRGNK